MTTADELRNWRRSTRCGEAGACVEVAAVGDTMVIRNSTDPDGPRLVVSRERWSAFLAEVRGRAA